MPLQEGCQGTCDTCGEEADREDHGSLSFPEGGVRALAMSEPDAIVPPDAWIKSLPRTMIAIEITPPSPIEMIESGLEFVRSVLLIVCLAPL